MVHFQLLRYLVTVGGIAARTRTALATRVQAPHSHADNRSLLTSFRPMLAMAEAQLEALASEGMTPTLLEEMGRMLTMFDAASEAASFGKEPELLVEWTAAKLGAGQFQGGANGKRAGGERERASRLLHPAGGLVCRRVRARIGLDW